MEKLDFQRTTIMPAAAKAIGATRDIYVSLCNQSDHTNSAPGNPLEVITKPKDSGGKRTQKSRFRKSANIAKMKIDGEYTESCNKEKLQK